MSSKYSEHTRSRALHLSRKGHCYADIGRQLEVSPSTVARWIRSASTEEKARPARSPRKHGGASGRRGATTRTAAQRRKALAAKDPERVAVAMLLAGASLAQVARRCGISQAQAERAYLAASKRVADSVKDTVGVPSLKNDRWVTAGGGHSGTVTREHPSARHSLTNTGLALAR